MGQAYFTTILYTKIVPIFRARGPKAVIRQPVNEWARHRSVTLQWARLNFLQLATVWLPGPPQHHGVLWSRDNLSAGISGDSIQGKFNFRFAARL